MKQVELFIIRKINNKYSLNKSLDSINMRSKQFIVDTGKSRASHKSVDYY